MASPTPHPLDAEMNFSGNSGNDSTDGPDAGELPRIPVVNSNTIKPAHSAEMSPELRDSFVSNTPNTVRKVHKLDAEALVLQQRLDDDEAA